VFKYNKILPVVIWSFNDTFIWFVKYTCTVVILQLEADNLDRLPLLSSMDVPRVGRQLGGHQGPTVSIPE
jgi:hypothetical protein